MTTNSPAKEIDSTPDVEGAESTFVPKFIRIPYVLMQDQALGRSDLVVYGVILWLTTLRRKKCFASNETIAKNSGIGISSVRRSLRKLEQHCHIKCTYRGTKKRRRVEIILLTTLDGPDRPSADTRVEQSNTPVMPAQIGSNDSVDRHQRAQRDITKDINNNKKIEDQALPNHQDPKPVDFLLTKFGSINEAYWSGSHSTPQRRAMANLLERHTVGEITAMINYIAAHQGEMYFPSITTPTQFEQKWSNIEARRRAEKRPGQKAHNLLLPGDPNKYENVAITQ